MRWLFVGVGVFTVVIAWVLHDLSRALDRASRLPEADD